MKKLLELTTHIAAGTGILLCAVGVIGRVAGHYHIAGVEASSLFQAGTGAMVFACLVMLYQGR